MLEEGVFAKDFSEITVGMQLIGWIKNIMSYGVFVEFPYGLVGLAPKSVSEKAFCCYQERVTFNLYVTVPPLLLLSCRRWPTSSSATRPLPSSSARR